MTKPHFDTYFISQIQKMHEVIPKLISKYKKFHLESDVVISETYLYMLDHIHNIDDDNNCQRYIFNFINKNILWNNSRLNRFESLNNITEGYTTPEEIDESEDNISFKIEIESWFNNRKALLTQYRQDLTNKEMIIIYDCYFVKGYQTGQTLGNHLNINKDYALRYIRQMKDDIIQYEIKLFIKNKLQ